MFEKFTEKAIKSVMLAQEESRRLGHNYVGTEQLLLGMLCEGSSIAYRVLRDINLTLRGTRTEVENVVGRGSGFSAVDIPFTPRSKKVLELSLKEADEFGHSYIGAEHILLALIHEGGGLGVTILVNLKANLRELDRRIIRKIVDADDRKSGKNRPDVESSSTAKWPTLEEFGTNLTEKAREGKLDPVVGREKEIERVIQILGRRRKNNPILIGEPGVGKTAIAEGLAQRIVNMDVPEILENRQIIALDLGLLIAGTKYRGEFEERLKTIMEEIKSANKTIILVIDEIHTLIGAGAAEGAIDAANILKPSLARGELQCIGATTIEEYRKYIEKDAALERRFQPVMVGEPSVE